MSTIDSSGAGTTHRGFEHGKLLALAFGIALVLGLCGCGGGGGSPTAPSTPTPAPVVSFAGTWSGTYTASNCGHEGAWPPCSDFISGFAPMTLTLTQTGSAVTGTLSRGGLVEGNLTTSVTGSVSADGHLLLNGSSTVVVSGLPMTITIMGWDTLQSGNSMTGGWSDRLTSAVVPGFVQWVNTISVSKGAVNPPVAAARERGQALGMIEDLVEFWRPGAK